jgi:hypothetical protein
LLYICCCAIIVVLLLSCFCCCAFVGHSTKYIKYQELLFIIRILLNC